LKNTHAVLAGRSEALTVTDRVAVTPLSSDRATENVPVVFTLFKKRATPSDTFVLVPVNVLL
jgi:hypothetical protein